jgi:Ca2+-transporting ATPase
MTTAWHSLTPDDTGRQLDVDPKRGLGAEGVEKRRAEDGPNALQDAKPLNPWVLLAGQFWSPLIALLFGAALIAGLLGEWVDAIAIAAIVILNAFVGFFQEYRAEKAIAALKKMTAPMARVIRDGRSLQIPAADVVRGDVLLLEAGDQVAADARLMISADLRVREAALTGESEPAEKYADQILPEAAALGDRANLVFLGTDIVAGTATALVVATGMRTEIGRIAGMLQAEEREVTPLQKQLAQFGKAVFWICLGLVGIIFLFGLLRDIPALELFLTSVSLAVAAVPEGLPAIVTIALALGVKRMARRKALIRRLHSVETLGSAEVICTDKTGTLTTGEMTVRELYIDGHTFQPGEEGLSPDGGILRNGDSPLEAGDAHLPGLQTLALIHIGCNNAGLDLTDGRWVVSGDPTEGALLAAGRKVGVPQGFPDNHPVLAEYPFDSDGKRHSVFRTLADGTTRLLVNGAPDVLIDLCDFEWTVDGVRPLNEEGRARILAANAAMAGRALRVIGSAYKDLKDFEGRDSGAAFKVPLTLPTRSEAERGLIFTGLAGLQDPPRAEATAAIARCREAGIRVVMITGDHPRTALAVAVELGLAEGPEQVLSGTDLDAIQVDATGKDGLADRIEGIRVYARVTAAHKLRIVKAWRARGAVTAMTGDGVNDAPALKGSDIGIAMGRTGTEVTKQTADVILADDNFATIVAAVEEGRGVYFNIRKTLQYLLAGNAGEILVMLFAVLWGWPSPLLAVHLLWINLVTDGLPALVLAADGAEASLMRRKPRKSKESLANKSFLLGMLGTGLLTAAVSLTVFGIGLVTGDLDSARSDAFDTLVLSEVFRALAYHSDRLPFWRCSWKAVWPLWLTIGAILALQTLCHEIKVLETILHLQEWDAGSFARIVSLSLIPLFVLEIRKVVLAKRWAAE